MTPANVKRIKHIAPHSIVRLTEGQVGYLETNTGGKPWVVVDPGTLAVEVLPETKVTLLATPHDIAKDWLRMHTSQLDTTIPSVLAQAIAAVNRTLAEVERSET